MDKVIAMLLYLWTNHGDAILTGLSLAIVRFLEKLKMKKKFVATLRSNGIDTGTDR